jgi:hypothetical protein
MTIQSGEAMIGTTSISRIGADVANYCDTQKFTTGLSLSRSVNPQAVMQFTPGNALEASEKGMYRARILRQRLQRVKF